MMMKKLLLPTAVLLFVTLLPVPALHAQVEASAQLFNRGKLWQSLFNGKVGPSFNNWRRTGIGLDWPGFEPSWIDQNIGGAPSYLLTGGLIAGCKRSADSVLVVEDWALSASTASPEAGSKYIITKHAKKFKNGENYALRRSAREGEEVIETVWEYNRNYIDEFGIQRMLPVRVTRRAHQWNGSQRDENYILYEYVIKNISPELKAYYTSVNDTVRLKYVADTLYQFYNMFLYAMHANTRSWTVLFPTEPPGAKNTWFFYDASRKMIYGRASDYLKTSTIETDFGFANSQGRIVNGQPSGEWLAPGYTGLRLVYASPNANGQTSQVASYGWSAADASFDFGGPLSDRNTEESQYDLIKNVTTARNFTQNPGDTVYMRRSRMWSMMNIGPYNILPGDSIVFSVAEIVDGVDYKLALDRTANIGPSGLQIFQRTADKAKFNYDQYLKGNGFNHPDPPMAPPFAVDFYKDRPGFVANVITWNDSTEAFADPDDGVKDLVGYKVWRSDYLPIGPWDSVGTVLKGSPLHFNSTTKTYSFVDSTVDIGVSYYYALTAYDSGRTVWNIDPTARFAESGNSARVVPLESSIYANRKITRFTSTLPAAKTASELDKVYVVPNPFVIGKGTTQIGESDVIQFVNLPNPCTIRIYTIRGDLVKTIDVSATLGGIANWNQVTDYGQYVESGVYLYHLDSPLGTKIGKFAIVR